jgi:hypothetical protein
MTPKFKIDDLVYIPSFDVEENNIVCLECYGKKYLTVILGNGEQVTIDCVACASGFDNPTGYVKVYDHIPKVKSASIVGINISKDNVSYNISLDSSNSKGDFYSYTTVAEENELFSIREMAEIESIKMSADWKTKEEIRLLNNKEHNKRDWSWHVHYYRSKIREAEKDLIRYKAKLEVAKNKTKEEKSDSK